MFKKVAEASAPGQPFLLLIELDLLGSEQHDLINDPHDDEDQ